MRNFRSIFSTWPFTTLVVTYISTVHNTPTPVWFTTTHAFLFLLLQMDLGVGSFVFSQGLVSAIPFVSQPYYLLEPTVSKLTKTIRKSVPILALGLIRVLLVKGTDYPVSGGYIPYARPSLNYSLLPFQIQRNTSPNMVFTGTSSSPLHSYRSCRSRCTLYCQNTQFLSSVYL